MIRHFTKTLCTLYTKQTYANAKPALSKIVKYQKPGYFTIQRLYSTEKNDTDNSDKVKKHKTREEIAQKNLDELIADPEMEKKFKVIQLEVQLAQSEGSLVPEELKASEMLQLLKTKTISHRRRLLRFFWLNKIKDKKELRRKEMRKVKHLDKLEEVNEGTALEYGLGHNTMFMRLYKKTMNNYYHSRVFNALLYGSKVIIDCVYTDQMKPIEVQNCAKQILLCIATNRIHNEPFYLHLTGINEDDKLFQCLKRLIPIIIDDDYPITLTCEPPTSLYDTDKLVYLSPHSRNVLQVYNADDVYIIGALVDKSLRKAFSLTRAKELGIRHARLPLEIADWSDSSSTSLTLNQTLEILLDQNCHRDWTKSLVHVPRRKLKSAHGRNEQRKLAVANTKFYHYLGTGDTNNWKDIDDERDQKEEDVSCTKRR